MSRRSTAHVLLLLLTCGFTLLPATQPALEEAERLMAEGSFALARDAFLALDRLDLGEETNAWIDFRLADALWRSLAATDTPDPTETERAREQLEALARETAREADRNRLWAEVQESLGDFWWTRRDSRNWGEAWPHYEQALLWWARSSDIDRARARYLAIVWKAVAPPHAEPFYDYGAWGNQLPETVLRNVLRISDDPAQRAHAQFLIAMNLRRQGGMPGQIRRVAEAFEAALESGPGSGWYDDALFHYAEWLMQSQEPDYVRALELFRRLTRELAKGQTRYYDDALRQIEDIAKPQLGVAVPEFFLPGSEIRYQIAWRNVSEVELALFAVDLTRDLRWRDAGSGEWLQRIDLPSRDALREWSWKTNDRGMHRPGQQTLDLEGELPPGAYLLEARGGGATARELVLVSAAAVVLKTSNRQALAFVCDAISGAPRGGAQVAFWIRTHDEGARGWSWRAASARADADGLARIDLPAGDRHVELFVAAADGPHQALALSSRWSGRRGEQDWRLYVFADRPAYRPGEVARWKVVARRQDGSVFTTPAGERIHYEITDPHGAKLTDGSLELNRFGSAWGEIELREERPLGEYQIAFHDPAGPTIGSAVLLRLEEYRLPEFRVDVRTPKRDGAPLALQPGEPVEAEIHAEYYFGGPLADATVEVLVYQRPLWIRWLPEREFPWLYEDLDSSRDYEWGGPGQIVHRETLTTDAAGRAALRFEPPFDPSQDHEYTIEARVTDAARREISGRGTVRASRQRYFAFLNPAHNLHRPGDEVRVAIRTLDANERPQSVEGQVRVTRDRWVEIWIDSAGREVAGQALERARRRERVFPPPPAHPGDPGWRLQFNGYEHEELLSRRMTTDAAGEVELAFTPEKEGFYRVTWNGDEEEAFPVLAETTVWVADSETVHIGYRPGGVQVLVDSDTFRTGATTPVMLSAPIPDSWVLFSVESGELDDYRVVHLTGTVKLLQLEIEERHVPNVFLQAALVRDGQLFLDSRQVVVPPVEHFLEIEVEADGEEYLPQQKGTLTVTARDHEGQPVVAEVALALVDESVFYIQQDYAGDPRPFFYGAKRAHEVLTQSSFHIRRYRPEAELGVAKDDLQESSADAGGVADARGGRVMAKSALERRDADMLAVAEESVAQAAPAMVAPGEEAAVQVRSDFRATALWVPDVVTGEDGTARVEVSLPDSLTTWRATARAATAGNRFGQATASTRTRKPLIVRLEAPRFFVVGDRALVSAVVNNNTDQPLDADVALGVEGPALVPLATARGEVSVPAGGERRMDWEVTAREPGSARLTVTARAGGHDDAMVLAYPVLEHGIEKLESRSGKVRADEARVTLDLPAERRAGSDSLSVQVTPSLAVTMLDALPYVIDYPYGCTEQTMSRFLPAVITARTLERLGLRPAQVAARIFGGIEPAHAAATHPDGAAELGRLDDMVQSGLARLADFQHGDGGWGWWKEGDSDPFMTAYVVWGLGLAADAGIHMDGQALRRGSEFLAKELVDEEERPELQAFMLHALTATTRNRPAPESAKVALEQLWARRDGLNAYARALLALSAHHMGDDERARVLLRNLVNGVKRDRAPDTSVVLGGTRQSDEHVVGTAHWGADGVWWRWADGPVEATAFALRALLAIDPENELVEPVTNWLIKNRRGAQWSNTRDTAIAVLALSDFLQASGELGSTTEFELWVNGRQVAARRIEPADVLAAPSRFEVDPGWLRDGPNEIRIVRASGDGPLYFSADARYFSLEEPIQPAGNEIFAQRSYEKLAGRPTLLAGFVYDRLPLGDGGRIESGERVEVSVIVETKNDYEYLVFEDLKPAGLEAVQLRSGEPLYARELSLAGDYTGRTRWVYQELRDRNVALFIDKLPQGTWEIRYELRAETPGWFHALPLVGHAMYVPEIRCNGAEVRLEVRDRP